MMNNRTRRIIISIWLLLFILLLCMTLFTKGVISLELAKNIQLIIGVILGVWAFFPRKGDNYEE